MLGGAIGVRQLCVGNIADQRVDKRELRLALYRRRALGADQLLGDELVKAQEDVRLLPAADGGDGARPEARPTTAASASSALRSGASRSRRAAISALMDAGVGSLGAGLESDSAAAALKQAAVLEEAHEFLGEQGVAAAPLEQCGLQGNGK